MKDCRMKMKEDYKTNDRESNQSILEQLRRFQEDESNKMKSVDYLMFFSLLKGEEIYTVGNR